MRQMAHETGPRPMVAVAGCVAQQEGERDPEALAGRHRRRRGHPDDPKTAADAGRAEREHRAVARHRHLDPYDDVSFPLGVTRRGDPVKAYVTIIEGCNDFCSFCVVPYTRGHERMRPKADILAEVRDAAAERTQGSAAARTNRESLSAPDDPTLRFRGAARGGPRDRGRRAHPVREPASASHQRRLIEAMRDLPKVCKHIHLPVQSGSTRVLQQMRRRYTREQLSGSRAEAFVRRSRTSAIDRYDRWLPWGDARDFEETLSLTDTVRYHSMFSFKYSERPNTLASKRLPDDVRGGGEDARIVELQALQRRIQSELHDRSRSGEPSTSWSTTSADVATRSCPAAPAATRWSTFRRRRSWLDGCSRLRIRRAGPEQRVGRTVARPRRSRRMQIEMTIKGLMVDPITNMPIVILRDPDGQKVLPIWVGVFEANAIALQIENVTTPRPMTHDLLRNVIEDLQATVEKIVVCDLKDNTFYALIHLRRAAGPVAIDARPERCHRAGAADRAPILVEE